MEEFTLLFLLSGLPIPFVCVCTSVFVIPYNPWKRALSEYYPGVLEIVAWNTEKSPSLDYYEYMICGKE